ncbi:MAG: hypothetical protein QM763_09400 [Agriterribacter sp.]
MKLWEMFLTIISWQAYAMYIGVGCVVYYILITIRFGGLKFFTREGKVNDGLPILKMEDGDKPGDTSQKPGQPSSNSHHAEIAKQFHNLTEEINALLLQAASEKLPREVLLNALMRLIRGYNFHNNDADLLQAVKEIIIVQAATICHINYQIEELII